MIKEIHEYDFLNVVGSQNVISYFYTNTFHQYIDQHTAVVSYSAYFCKDQFIYSIFNIAIYNNLNIYNIHQMYNLNP